MYHFYYLQLLTPKQKLELMVVLLGTTELYVISNKYQKNK